jgi:hypothetical protein
MTMDRHLKMVKVTNKKHRQPVDRLLKRTQDSKRVGKRGSMIEVLTPEQLIEALMPWDGEELFVCVRDERGRVLVIKDVGDYLRQEASGRRGVKNCETCLDHSFCT